MKEIWLEQTDGKTIAALKDISESTLGDPFTRLGLRTFVTIQLGIRAMFDCEFNTPTDDSRLPANSVAKTPGVA
uniref:hypothetical protein n=1 Tax=Burkholderia sp. M701 TaxID=326454 RepID=UPI0012ECB7C1|nr:hypothetical protein [Burkholderia sp. M701]